MTKNKVYQYTAAIKASEVGKGGAYVIFPYDIREEFGRGRVKVYVTFDGVRKAIREQLHKTIGDSLIVTVQEKA